MCTAKHVVIDGQVRNIVSYGRGGVWVSCDGDGTAQFMECDEAFFAALQTANAVRDEATLANLDSDIVPGRSGVIAGEFASR